MSIGVRADLEAEHESLSSRVRSALAQRRSGTGGLLYRGFGTIAVLAFVAIIAALVVALTSEAWPAFRQSGVSFIFSGDWNPDAGHFGSGVFIIDTLITTAVAVAIAVPIGMLCAAFLSEFCPKRLRTLLSTVTDLMAAVPSIVVGLWGLIVLEPLFERDIDVFLEKLPLPGFLFGAPAYGTSVLLAAVVLAIMILPTVIALTRSAFAGVSMADREAAMALGGTRAQVVRRAVIPASSSGIQAAVTLALGRALGESIAVALVVGGGVVLPHSLLAPGSTLGSAIINFFGEADTPIDRAAVVGLAVELFVLTALVNVVGQFLRRRNRASSGPPVLGPPVEATTVTP